jgi:hypothetical protein
MRFIILDIEKTLGDMNASRKTVERITKTVTRIRKELFGNKSED